MTSDLLQVLLSNWAPYLLLPPGVYYLQTHPHTIITGYHSITLSFSTPSSLEIVGARE